MYKLLKLNDWEMRELLELIMNNAEFTVKHDLLIEKICTGINELEAEMEDTFAQVHALVANREA